MPNILRRVRNYGLVMQHSFFRPLGQFCSGMAAAVLLDFEAMSAQYTRGIRWGKSANYVFERIPLLEFSGGRTVLAIASTCIIRKYGAGVVQWQYRSFPSFGRGFDSHRPLQIQKKLRQNLIFHIFQKRCFYGWK